MTYEIEVLFDTVWCDIGGSLKYNIGRVALGISL